MDYDYLGDLRNQVCYWQPPVSVKAVSHWDVKVVCQSTQHYFLKWLTAICLLQLATAACNQVYLRFVLHLESVRTPVCPEAGGTIFFGLTLVTWEER